MVIGGAPDAVNNNDTKARYFQRKDLPAMISMATPSQ
jgi:hypothetical protein